jgi:hypothetical protein
MGCAHYEQWEWIAESGAGCAPGRRLRCTKCQEILPIGPTFDALVEVHWETIALDVAGALRDRRSKDLIDADLHRLGATDAEVNVFWHGVHDAACGTSCLSVRSVMEQISALARAYGGRGAVDAAPNGAVAYAAGALAQSFVSDVDGCAGCSPPPVVTGTAWEWAE